MKQVKIVKQLPIEAIRRDFWPNEASRFTPWLVDNINLLSEATGLSLKVLEREAHTGRLSADILCIDSVSGERVIVENQIEQSDHGHLGQIVSYVAGLGARVAIWVAPSFRAEHLAAIKWLNETLGSDYSFYAVSFALYSIGEAVGVRFSTDATPDYSRERAVSDLDRLKLDFWTGFKDYINSLPMCPFRVYKPSPRGYINIPIGSSVFHVVARVSTVGKRISVQLWAEGERAKEAYDELRRRAYLDSKKRISDAIEWKRHDDKKASIVALSTEADFRKTESWQTYYCWFATTIVSFINFFGAYLDEAL